jgi:hypothetical protein
MNNTTKGILTVLVVGVLGYVAYKRFALPNSKKVVVNYMKATFGTAQDYDKFVETADKDYINAWSKAIMDGKDTFNVKGVTYVTYGGKSKK